MIEAKAMRSRRRFESWVKFEQRIKAQFRMHNQSWGSWSPWRNTEDARNETRVGIGRISLKSTGAPGSAWRPCERCEKQGEINRGKRWADREMRREVAEIDE